MYEPLRASCNVASDQVVDGNAQGPERPHGGLAAGALVPCRDFRQAAQPLPKIAIYNLDRQPECRSPAEQAQLVVGDLRASGPKRIRQRRR